MTREEALQILDTIPTIGEQVDALELAIEALKQEPCEDCISRADLIKVLIPKIKTRRSTIEIKNKLIPLIKSLNPIQPKANTDVLDKIKTEIEFIPTIEWKDDGTTYILASFFKKQVLEIIDKYKAESEE